MEDAMKVSDILKTKGDAVETIQSWCSLTEAVARLAGPPPIGALVVCDDGRGHLDGLITERDILRGLNTLGPDISRCQVADVMIHHVPVCAPEDTLAELMSKMTVSRHRHLPVVEQGIVCGLVSIGDVVRHRLREMQLQTDVMRDMYIATR